MLHSSYSKRILWKDFKKIYTIISKDIIYIDGIEDIIYEQAIRICSLLASDLKIYCGIC